MTSDPTALCMPNMPGSPDGPARWRCCSGTIAAVPATASTVRAPEACAATEPSPAFPAGLRTGPCPRRRSHALPYPSDASRQALTKSLAPSTVDRQSMRGAPSRRRSNQRKMPSTVTAPTKPRLPDCNAAARIFAVLFLAFVVTPKSLAFAPPASLQSGSSCPAADRRRFFYRKCRLRHAAADEGHGGQRRGRASTGRRFHAEPFDRNPRTSTSTSLWFVLASARTAVDRLPVSTTSAFLHRTTRSIELSSKRKPSVSAALHASSSSSSRLPLSVPCNRGTVEVQRTLADGTERTYGLSYRLYRPMSLSSRKAAPIVALHGGPSVPSDYLLPLVQAVPYRSILFYDQLGCGDSDEPKDVSAYSIDLAVDDLQLVLNKLGVRRYHLYGQSFGGILAYEFLKRIAQDDGDSTTDNNNDDDDDDRGCLSVILSSTPTSVKLVEEEAQKLVSSLESPEMFRETHQCRLPEMPEALSNAYAKAGTTWRGTTAIPDYVATPPADTAERMPSCLTMRGEHDFVTEACTKEWKAVMNKSRSVREKVLPGCSHHGLLENPLLYGEAVDTFFSEYD